MDRLTQSTDGKNVSKKTNKIDTFLACVVWIDLISVGQKANQGAVDIINFSPKLEALQDSHLFQFLQID